MNAPSKLHRHTNPYALTFSDLTRTLVSVKDQIAQPQRVVYRDFIIEYDPPPIPKDCNADWQFVHKDYCGDEDRRTGFDGSLQGCKNQIDEYYDDIEFAPGPPLPAEDEPNGWDDFEHQYSDDESVADGFEDQW